MRRRRARLLSRAASGPSGLRSSFCAGVRLAALEDHAAVEEQGPGELEAEPALEVAGHQLGRHRGAHVVGDDEDRPPVAVAADQLLGQVGLPAEA